jgi:hypothetical protein
VFTELLPSNDKGIHRHTPHTHASDNSSTVACIRCHGNVFIVAYLNEIESEGEDWIQLALERVHWCALAEAVMNFGYRTLFCWSA